MRILTSTLAVLLLLLVACVPRTGVASDVEAPPPKAQALSDQGDLVHSAQFVIEYQRYTLPLAEQSGSIHEVLNLYELVAFRMLLEAHFGPPASALWTQLTTAEHPIIEVNAINRPIPCARSGTQEAQPVYPALSPLAQLVPKPAASQRVY